MDTLSRPFYGSPGLFNPLFRLISSSIDSASLSSFLPSCLLLCLNFVHYCLLAGFFFSFLLISDLFLSSSGLGVIVHFSSSCHHHHHHRDHHLSTLHIIISSFTSFPHSHWFPLHFDLAIHSFGGSVVVGCSWCRCLHCLFCFHFVDQFVRVSYCVVLVFLLFCFQALLFSVLFVCFPLVSIVEKE